MADHKFGLHKAKEADFVKEGLRAFFSYRDLGVEEATNGDFAAHVIRAEELIDKPGGKHTHQLEFQMVYMLKGWAKFWYEDKGECVLEVGDCVYQRPGIVHELRDFSADCEMLEIVSPAKFGTQAAD
ncbi:MAG TPA: cupin [Rhizobiales bacterium]|nr:cupin [Hyphomicrobiales bacterium]